MSLISILPGIILLFVTAVVFARLRPRNGVVHPFLASRIRNELVAIGIVLGVALGMALIIQGAVRMIA